MKTLFLKHPITRKRRVGTNVQTVQHGEFQFEKRGPDDVADDERLVKSCFTAFVHDGGHPVSYDELLDLKLEEGIIRGAREIFGDIPA